MVSHGELVGWAAAFCSMLAFGSFGVPIKSKQAVSVDIDPLVFQSYKTIMCFLTCWLVLLAGVPFSFTPWGIVSGAFWVPGGVATVYAIKKAGLAIGIGVGSSFIVLVSFIWGIFIFEEQVHSKLGATFAIFCMASGLFGMAYYSSPESASLENVGDDQRAMASSSAAAVVSYEAIAEVEDNDEIETGNDAFGVKSAIKITERTAQTSFSSERSDADAEDAHYSHQWSTPREERSQTSNQDRDDDGDSSSSRSVSRSANVVLFNGRVTITERNLGILAAGLLTGVWGGSILVPMKWCNANAKGVHYLISFAIGASIVTTFLWVVRIAYNTYYYGSLRKAYDRLPSFHFRVMCLPGGISGTLWSIGNFFSMISVKYLGEGVGYPLVQTSILVSGLWGIFYFKEITGTRRISLWLCSSSLTIFGILLLSYEHVDKSAGGN